MSGGARERPAAYYFRRALDSITASPVITAGTLASLGTSVTFVAAVFLVAANADRVTGLWANAGIDAAVYLEPTVEEARVVELGERLTDDPLVRSVRYVSPEEGWQFLADSLGDSAELLAGMDSSVIPAAFEVSLEGGLGPDDGRAWTERWSEVGSVDDVQYNRLERGRRGQAAVAVHWMTIALAVLAVVAGAVMVAMSFQLAAHTRRDELEVLRLMGAVGVRYWGPVVLAGVIEGVLAAVVGLAALLAIYVGVAVPLTKELPLLEGTLTFLAPSEAILLVLGGAALGAYGAVVGLWSLARWR